MTSAETFEHIIRHQSSQELVPFLLALEKKDIVPVRKKAQGLKKELEEYKEWEVKPGRTQWRSLVTPEQSRMLFLAGLATYSRKEALTSNFNSLGYLNTDARGRAEHDITSLVDEVLDYAQPVWLTEWLIRNARTNLWSVPDFNVLLNLAERQLIEPDNWLLAQATARYLNVLGSEIGTARTLALYKAAGTKLNDLQAKMWAQLQLDRPELAAGLSLPTFEQMVFADLKASTNLLRIGIPLLFDYDTLVDSASTYNTQGKVTTTVSWLDVLPQLVESGHLDRADLLGRCLLALRRDFRRPLLTWFKNLFVAFKPTKAERLARQAELVELLAHPLPLVVNFALDQLKDLWPETTFEPAPLLLYAEGLMTRQDLKTALRTLLGAFEKLLKRQPALAAPLARLATSALANADAAVQERAAKLLTSILGAKKPLLTPTETTEITDTISLYADLLAATARTILAPFLAATPATDSAAGATTYAPQPNFEPDLSEATAIMPVQDWHELLFLTGQVLQYDDPAALERWLDGLLRLRPRFPADYAQQLRPYLQQALPWVLKGKTEAEATAILSDYDFGNGYNGLAQLVQALLISWFVSFEPGKVARVSMADHPYHSPDPLLRVEQRRLAAVEEQLRTLATPLPQLSTPSHAPHWVAPSVLVRKLLAYQAAGQTPDSADLALALARTAFQADADAAQARQQLPSLDHEGLRELLHWFLAPASENRPLPTPVATGKSVVKVLTERLSKLIPSRPSPAPIPLPDALAWLWVVAARTRLPDASLEELRPLSDYPGVAVAWQPGWHFEAKSHTYKQSWNKEQPEVTHTWQELRVPTSREGQPPPSPLLLYSVYAQLKQKDQYYSGALSANVPFLLALLPNNPDPLHWHILRTACRTDDQSSEERAIMQHTLNALLVPGPRFTEVASVLLAVGFTHQAPVCRAVALEVLLAAVGAGRLVPAALGAALGKLLAAEFVPVQRLSDNLAQARAISPTTDDALSEVLDTLLPYLPATPLRNTRKLIEVYADLQARTQRPVPEAVQIRLRAWSSSATLRKAVGSLV